MLAKVFPQKQKKPGQRGAAGQGWGVKIRANSSLSLNLNLTDGLIVRPVVGILVYKRLAHLSAVQHKYAGHLETVAEVGVGERSRCAMPFQHRSLKAPDPVHQAKKLLWSAASQSEGAVVYLLRVADVVNGVEFVLFEELFRDLRIRRHVYEHDSEALRLQFFATFGNVGYSLSTKRTSKKAEEYQQNGLIIGHFSQRLVAVHCCHVAPDTGGGLCVGHKKKG